MPIEYRTFGCKFKCGRNHSQRKKTIEAHEAQCWYNPENRTCKTCKFEDYFSDTSGTSFSGGWHTEPDWWIRACKRGDGEPAIAAIYKKLEADNPDNTKLYGVQIPPVSGCEFWEAEQ